MAALILVAIGIVALCVVLHEINFTSEMHRFEHPECRRRTSAGTQRHHSEKEAIDSLGHHNYVPFLQAPSESIEVSPGANQNGWLTNRSTEGISYRICCGKENSKIRKELHMNKGIFGLGIGVTLVWLVIVGALLVTWVKGIIFGFSQSVLLGILSLIPPIGIIEGILLLLGVLPV